MAERSWVEWVGRAGYAAKGVVYAAVGALTLASAVGLQRGETAGTKEALETFAGGTGGRVALALIAAGLLAYVAWRFVQAIGDAEDKGRDAKGIVMRIGFAVSGLAYLSLAGYAATLAWPSAGAGGGGSGEDALTARVLGLPGGRFLVAGAGLAILGVAARHMQRARKASFMGEFEGLPDELRDETKRIGQAGLAARSVTFAIIGAFLVIAAWRHDPEQAKGLGEAFVVLGQQPMGTALLVIVAAGFVAYALYCLARARFRRFDLGS